MFVSITEALVIWIFKMQVPNRIFASSNLDFSIRSLNLNQTCYSTIFRYYLEVTFLPFARFKVSLKVNNQMTKTMKNIRWMIFFVYLTVWNPAPFSDSFACCGLRLPRKWWAGWLPKHFLWGHCPLCNDLPKALLGLTSKECCLPEAKTSTAHPWKSAVQQGTLSIYRTIQGPLDRLKNILSPRHHEIRGKNGFQLKNASILSNRGSLFSIKKNFFALLRIFLLKEH